MLRRMNSHADEECKGCKRRRWKKESERKTFMNNGYFDRTIEASHL